MIRQLASNLAQRTTAMFKHKDAQAEEPAKPADSGPKLFDPQQEPAVLLGTDPATGKITLGNVRWGFLEEGKTGNDWKGIFRDTTFDPSKVKEVYAAVRLGQPHALLMFEFEPGAVTSATGQKDIGLAVSMEARMPLGVNYDKKKGMHKIWGPVYQMGTFSDGIQKACRLRGCELKRFRLNLTQEQKETLVKDAVQEAIQDRTGEYYHTLNNNCITAIFSALNQVADYKINQVAIPGMLRNPFTFLPEPMGTELDAHHLLAKDTPVIINEPPGKTGQVPAWTQSPAVKKWLQPALAATARVTEALVPGSLLTGRIGLTINLLDGRTLSNAIQRVSAPQFESSDNYSIPEQTAAELATSVVHK